MPRVPIFYHPLLLLPHPRELIPPPDGCCWASASVLNRDVLRLLNLTRFGLHVRFGQDLVLFPDTSLSDPSAHDNQATTTTVTSAQPTPSTHCSPNTHNTAIITSSPSPSTTKGWWATLTCLCCCRHAKKSSRIT